MQENNNQIFTYNNGTFHMDKEYQDASFMEMFHKAKMEEYEHKKWR